ncbi:eukaryotic-like serine/threonine-protein kinase [Frankia sp. AiPs1]|uniref:serine/threonine-protein kinase n=1 Tax=Frankia sp. AiPa1 TaxID=573492 RepID=UPI00202B7EF1|nr:serine/threonine-protein kinase [Frankia sp. AiPa1]MCL9762718.1 serine/threonine-protein kinase [Frankia sp. AiPa1]
MIVDRVRVAEAVPHYVLGEELGSGAFGLVLRARHRQMRRPAAIKVMPARTAGGERIDFGAEARLLGGLDHPHVVRVYDYVEADDLCLVVMELLAGGTLTRRRGTLTPEQVCVVGLSVAAALGHAHDRGVLHRDVKADNILFASDGTAKVGDFGIAKLFEGSATTASKVAGTPASMAPEQIEGGRLGPATDLYALGTVLYQLLTGRPPFDPRQPLHLLWHRQLNEPIPPMDGVAPPLSRVVLRALEREPEARHPDARAFARDLAGAASRVHGAGWLTRAGLPLHLDDEVRRLSEDALTARATSEDALTARATTVTVTGATAATVGGGTAWGEYGHLVRGLGPDHPDTLAAGNDLAVHLSAVGDPRAARDLDEDILARRRRVLGVDHPDTLTSAHNLAVDLAELGESSGARDLYEDTLTRRRRVLGPDHPDTLDTGTNLGVLLGALGELGAARELGEDTLRRRRRTLGADHPATLTAAYNLATRRSAEGDHEAARELADDTLSRRRRILGAEHPDTLLCAYNLAVYLGRLGRYRQARDVGEAVLDARRRTAGPSHPDTVAAGDAVHWWGERISSQP